jgi:hypothetical protein
MMDYHFGRLSPELNAAVERHVRSCAICQREGLVHLATEKREAVRLSRRSVKVNSQKRRMTRMFELLLTVCLLLLLVPVLAIPAYRQRLPWLNFSAGAHHPRATATSTPTPTPAPLNPTVTFATQSSGAAAIVLSPNGKQVALATILNGAPVVSIWDAGTGKQVEALAYSFNAVPGALAWSSDGRDLAAANGTTVMVWDVTSGVQLWSIILPQGPAVRVYDVEAGGVAQRPNPTVVFAQSPFAQWGADGQIAPAPANAAGLVGVALPGGPIIGVWQVAGSHIFRAGAGQVDVGISSADAAARAALLTWSPDNRFLLWGYFARPVATSPAAPSGAGAAPASTPVPGAVQPPDGVAQTIAAHVAASTNGDALLWVAPNGAWVAFCDRTLHAAPLVVMAPDQGRPVAQMPDACTGLTIGSLTWRADSSGFALAVPAHAVATYSVPAPPHG